MKIKIIHNTHTLRNNRDVQTARQTNDVRRMALELELAGRAVQHTPAASSLCRTVSSALALSTGQIGRTHISYFRNIFTTHQNINVLYNIYYERVFYTNIQHTRIIIWPRRMCENRPFSAPPRKCVIIIIIVITLIIMIGNNKSNSKTLLHIVNR